MRNTHEFAKNNQKTIMVGLIIFAVILVLGVIIFTEVTAKYKTDIFFNADSQIPDSMAAIKYGKQGSNGVTELRVGEPYQVSFTVHSQESGKTDYNYVIDSKMLKKTESFTLNPGEDKTVTLIVTPLGDDMQALDKVSYYNTEDVIDLSRDSWLGEKITFDRSVVFGDIAKAYSYSPISVNITGFGKILNLNVTLQELREKPYTKVLTESESTQTERKVTEYPIKMWVEADKLHIQLNKTVKTYASKPELFKINLYKKNDVGAPPAMLVLYNETTIFRSVDSTQEQTPASIAFLYQIV